MNLILSIFLSWPTVAQVKRISEVEFDLSEPRVIYMTPGRSSVMDFPCDISNSVLGLHDDIKVEIGPDSPRTLLIWLSHDFSQPTNLVVRCDKKVFVFDIKPGRANHQDYVNITDYYESAVSKRWEKKLIATSQDKKDYSPLIPQKKKLIGSSAWKRRKKELIK